MFIINTVSTCFVHHYAHLQENKDRVLLHVVCLLQRSTPHAVTHGLCSPEDGPNDVRNMLRVLIINMIDASCWFSLSLHNSKCVPPPAQRVISNSLGIVQVLLG